jgi:hypothetical protein
VMADNWSSTCWIDGLVSTEPSRNLRVGTTRSPLLTAATHSAALLSVSMLTSRNGMPRSASRCFSRMHGPHVVVEKMVKSASPSVVSVTSARMPQ